MRRRRPTIDSFGLGYGSDCVREAPTVSSFAGYCVGQRVTVHRRQDATSRQDHRKVRSFHAVSGTIARIVKAPWWTFAVVKDADGGSHACGLEELS